MQQSVETLRATRTTHLDTTRGFTLIEVMIVTAIIGILVAVAYPSYGKFVIESRRTDGHLALMVASQAMERCKSTRYSYANCDLSEMDQTSPEKYYTLKVEKTATTFTLTASPEDQQKSDTECPTITLNHLSVKGPANPNGTDPSLCWKG